MNSAACCMRSHEYRQKLQHTLQYTAPYYNAWQHTAARRQHYNTLQHHVSLCAAWNRMNTSKHCNTHCNTPQCTAQRCSTLQLAEDTATHYNTHCSTLQHKLIYSAKHCTAACCMRSREYSGDATVCCSVLHCIAVYCSVLQFVAVCCSVLQCVAVCCSVLQCAAVYCSVLHRCALHEIA